MSKKEIKIKIDKLGDAFQGKLTDMKQTCQNGSGGGGPNPATFLVFNILAICSECFYFSLPEEIVDFIFADNILAFQKKSRIGACEVPECRKLVSFIFQFLYPRT